MTNQYLTIASLRQDASAKAMIRVLSPTDPARAMDTHHQLVWSLFAKEDDSRSERSFLWRVDGDTFVILSEEVPIDSHSLFDLRVRRLDTDFRADQRLAFRLRVNATVCRTTNEGTSRRQQRHDVVMDAVRRLQAENEGLERADARDRAVPLASSEWLARTGSSAGFALDALGSSSYRTVDLARGRKKSARFGVLDLDGILVVRDPDQFAKKLSNGFGRAKSFGCGLMLLVPA